MEKLPPSLPSIEELALIRNYVLLPMLLDMLETIHTKMGLERQTLKPLFLKSIRKLQDDIHADLVKVRAEMKRTDIKVWEDAGHKDFTTFRYRYKVRGYEDEFGMMREWTKSQLSVKLGAYIDKMFK